MNVGDLVIARGIKAHPANNKYMGIVVGIEKPITKFKNPYPTYTVAWAGKLFGRIAFEWFDHELIVISVGEKG